MRMIYQEHYQRCYSAAQFHISMPYGTRRLLPNLCHHASFTRLANASAAGSVADGAPVHREGRDE